MADPYGVTVFCDDIRHEINGKMILIGCYGSEMTIFGPSPAVLPSLAALVNIRLPIGIDAESFRVVVTKEDSRGTEDILSVDTKLPPSIGGSANEPLEKLGGSDKILSITLPCQWSPAQFSGQSFIRVRAHIDGMKVVKLGTLMIKFHEDTESKPETLVEDTARSK